MKFKIRSIIPILMSITIISMLIVGCSSSEKATANKVTKPEVAVSEGEKGMSESPNSTVNSDAKTENSSMDTLVDPLKGKGKIMRSGTIQMETLSFDESVKQILNKTNSIGGYVQSSDVSGTSIEVESFDESRRGEFILRIPKNKFDGFMLDIAELGSITNQQISTEDITSVYFDTQAHLKSLTVQEERLLELLKKTGELKDIIALEKELSNVRYEIETLTGSLKKWDNLIDFCTLNIHLSEVHKIKENPVSFGEKIAIGFVNSVKSLINLGRYIVVIVFILIPYSVILFILFLIIRYIYIRRKRK